MSTATPFGHSIDRLEQIAACLRAVADLLTPERDLHTVNREDFATLLYVLTTEASAAHRALSESRAASPAIAKSPAPA